MTASLPSWLKLPHLPDTLFSNNRVDDATMQFILLEALKMVNAHMDHLGRLVSIQAGLSAFERDCSSFRLDGVQSIKVLKIEC